MPPGATPTLGENAAASATDFLLKTAGAGIGYGLNKAAAGIAWDRQKDWATRGPTYMMKGLRDAGLNPILAATGGFSPGASRAPQAAPAQDVVKPNTLQGQQMRLLREQTNAAEASAQKSRNDAELSRIRGELESYDAPRRRFAYDYYSTEEGRETARAKEIHDSNPNTWPGAIIRELQKLRQSGRERNRTNPPSPHPPSRWEKYKDHILPPNYRGRPPGFNYP